MLPWPRHTESSTKNNFSTFVQMSIGVEGSRGRCEESSPTKDRGKYLSMNECRAASRSGALMRSIVSGRESCWFETSARAIASAAE